MPKRLFPDLCTVAEAAKLLGCHPTRIYQLRDAGQFPGARQILNRILIPIAEVRAARTRNKTPGWPTGKSRKRLP